MQLTKPLLLAKRQLALSVRDELAAKLNAQVGVLETLDHLLAILDQAEPAAEIRPPAAPPLPSAARAE